MSKLLASLPWCCGAIFSKIMVSKHKPWALSLTTSVTDRRDRDNSRPRGRSWGEQSPQPCSDGATFKSGQLFTYGTPCLIFSHCSFHFPWDLRWGETVYLCTYLHKQNHTTCVSAVGCLPAVSSFSAVTEGERPAQVVVGVRHPAPTEALTPEPVLCKKSNHHSEKPAHHSWRKARAATTTQVSEKYINKILLKKKNNRQAFGVF